MAVPYAEVIGDPVAHSKSPLIHNFWLEKLGLPGNYRATHVQAEDLPDFFAERRADPLWRGCNVTIPHKLAVLAYSDATDTAVREAGAANCILPRPEGLVACNTDGFGVDAAIDRSVASACIFGAGGAARAAVASLEVRAALEVRLIARDAEKGRALLQSFNYPPEVSGFGEAAAMMERADLVINATPLGMTGYPAMPAQILAGLEGMTRDAIVFDMVYAPLETQLLAAAKALRRHSVDGLVMLIAQASAAFRLFFGLEAPRQHDAELRRLLAS